MDIPSASVKELPFEHERLFIEIKALQDIRSAHTHKRMLSMVNLNLWQFNELSGIPKASEGVTQYKQEIKQNDKIIDICNRLLKEKEAQLATFENAK